MVRFRLTAPFIAVARDQIRGGVWYKPSWWDAVRKIPPLPTLPRIKKKEIRNLRFLEDRLTREFEEKNPAVAEHDHFNFLGESPKNTVAADFAARQIRAMQQDFTEEESYAITEQWLIENGPEVLEQLDLPEGAKRGLKFLRDPMLEMSPEHIALELLRRDRQALQDGIRIDMKERPNAYKEVSPLPPYRDFRSKDLSDAIRERRVPEYLAKRRSGADAEADDA